MSCHLHAYKKYKHRNRVKDVFFVGNNQLLPFERNRYYVGKLLTSADFLAEQTYGNHKRQFLNEMMFGSGIVCGLGVYSLDDLSIMVDSGVAVDGCGREIAVENAVVRKLSAVEGFEELETERATLCLRYQEEDVHPVYTVRGQENGENYECNRIREGWQIFLRDSSTIRGEYQPEPEFLTESVLYEDEDYSIVCRFPAQSACNTTVRMEVVIQRLREEAGLLTLKTVLQTPAFSNEAGEHELPLELRELAVDDKVTVSYYMTAQSTPAAESVILADGRTIRVRVGEQERKTKENFALRTAVVSATVDQIVDQAVTSASLEMRELFAGQEYVPLAEIDLQRTRNAYLIEEIRTVGIRRYIRTAANAALREELKAWYQPQNIAADTDRISYSGEKVQEKYGHPTYATGICEIPLGGTIRRGQIAYSDEIIHGLGPGNVYVTVGTEYLVDDVKLGATTRNTIYGNRSLFVDEDISVAAAETAVKVMNERGSFVVAAKMLEDSNQVLLTLRWVAVMLPNSDEESKIEKLAGKSIAAVQPTVVVGTRESHYFNVRFNNMEPCTLTYELTEKNSGEITSDGIYTAPGREGVFEIRISCANQPLISTYAYAVVKKKDVQELSEES